MSSDLEPVDALPAVPASDVKKHGWRGVMRTLAREGPVVVTNHERPEAVIVPVEAYAHLVALARQERSRVDAALETLRQRFDARLAVLRQPGAGARLRSAMRAGPKLRGKVKAGDTC